MRKIVAAGIAAGALALGVAAPASALTTQGKITYYGAGTGGPGTYKVVQDNYFTWGALPYNTYFVNCQSEGVSDGSKISFTNLGRVEQSFHKVNITVNSGYTPYIACI